VTRTLRVDATGLSCPAPVLELAKGVAAVEPGDVVELIATDPTARVDVPVWCRLQRHDLRAITALEIGWRFEVERTR
jgi:tRNA 2-thiouridine synthesizing protein A